MNHCDRVLELLADGREHSHHELYALNVVAHSRVAELRGKGHTITQRRVAGADGEPDYIYRLLSLGEPVPRAAASSTGSPSERGRTPDANARAAAAHEPSTLPEAPCSLDSCEQLAFEVAA